jgi:hypothetical protein
VYALLGLPVVSAPLPIQAVATVAGALLLILLARWGTAWYYKGYENVPPFDRGALLVGYTVVVLAIGAMAGAMIMTMILSRGQA